MQNRVCVAFTGWVVTVALFLAPVLTTSVIHAQDSTPITAEADDKSSPLLHYQGRLTDGNGEPVPDGNHTLVFKLYGQQEGGTPLWQETQNVETTDGVFSAQLGAVNAIDGVDFEQTLYLGIEVDGSEELSPRTRLTSSPYALFAESVGDSSVTTLNLAPDAVTASKIASGEVGESELDGGAVTVDKIGSGAVTGPKIEDRAITSAKLDFGAVDSSALKADAVFKTLDPTLNIGVADDFVGVNQEVSLTGSSVFGVTYPGGFADGYGGMYVNTENAEGWPFYGYGTDGTARAWHHYDHGDRRWRLIFDGATPETRLEVTGSAVLPGGDDQIALGSDSSRWSTVYAANGVTQTSDRRLKTDIQSVSYGLEEVLRLEPVSYRWKDEASASGEGARKLGLVAQQVREVIAEVVHEPDSEEGYLGMDYSELIPVLVKAVQQQQAIIERKNEKLRAKDRQMEARVEALEKQVQRLADAVQKKSEPSARPATTVSSE